MATATAATPQAYLAELPPEVGMLYYEVPLERRPVITFGSVSGAAVYWVLSTSFGAPAGEWP